ncbi:hypothetical protein HT746_01360 [Burkholderia pyrrocinia]|uniref:hypothetical protein n=1 Tax=Burkholderia pyrrocinia TaxID=60550 RepID=UPI001575E03A|nr:hypothetical protein [Burkholderia pyrrocinia]NTX25809.1 hypothetical protein [Burkholderia pyrrocinia]
MRRRIAAADSRQRFGRTGALICHAFDVHVFSCPPDSRVHFAQPPPEGPNCTAIDANPLTLSILARIGHSGFPEKQMTAG